MPLLLIASPSRCSSSLSLCRAIPRDIHEETLADQSQTRSNTRCTYVPMGVLSFIFYLRLILVSVSIRALYMDLQRVIHIFAEMIPNDAGISPARAEVDFLLLVRDVDAPNKSLSSTFKRYLSSYALSYAVHYIACSVASFRRRLALISEDCFRFKWPRG